MLVKFKFNNFRSIKEFVELSLEASNSEDLEEYYVIKPNKKLKLLKVAAIYGANASGKSNILKALEFLRNLILEPVEKKTDKIKYDRFAFDEAFKKGNSEFQIDFFHEGIRYDYRIILNPDFIVSESLYFYHPNRALVFSRETNEEKELAIISIGSKIKLSAEDKKSLEANTLWNRTVFGGLLKTNIDFPYVSDPLDWFGNTLRALVTPNLNLMVYISLKIEEGLINKERLIEILNKADLNVSNVILKDLKIKLENVHNIIMDFMEFDTDMQKEITRGGVLNTREIFFEHKIEKEDGTVGNALLPYDEESLGTQRFYQFSGLIDMMIQKGQVLPIDELESSLHPDLIKHFLLTFLVNTRNSQLIFSTHFRELMNESEILRNDIFHFTEKKNDGSTDLFALSDFDTTTIRKSSSIYNAYKIGKLGAVPELNDTYIETH